VATIQSQDEGAIIQVGDLLKSTFLSQEEIEKQEWFYKGYEREQLLKLV
jgi:hypothetical protein